MRAGDQPSLMPIIKFIHHEHIKHLRSLVCTYHETYIFVFHRLSFHRSEFGFGLLQDFANRYNFCDRARTLSHTHSNNNSNHIESEKEKKYRTDWHIRISIFEYALSTENNEIENKNPNEVEKKKKNEK